jgi:hypothetical protein
MPLHKDVFFRSHVVELHPKEKPVSTYNEPKWPEYVTSCDFETTLDPKEQALLFAFYRVCRLQNKNYVCIEEGIVTADNLSESELANSLSIARHG